MDNNAFLVIFHGSGTLTTVNANHVSKELIMILIKRSALTVETINNMISSDLAALA